jgi:hypothetical protein
LYQHDGKNIANINIEFITNSDAISFISEPN